MKKRIILLFAIVVLISFTGCNQEKQTSNNANEKITVITTLFPQYDFAKIVGGDKAEVTKLLPNGVESHSYEPTPGDIVSINEADLFFYTGASMEPWAATIISGISSDTLNVVDVSKNVPIIDDEKIHTGETSEQHEDGADPHIWTDPIRAIIMVDNITKAFSNYDPKNAEYYKSNAEKYKAELTALDEDIKTTVEEGQRKEIIFGGRFAFLYFCDRYGLTYDAAYDSCSDSGEPSAKKVAEIIDEIEEENLPVIYYEELRKPIVAQSIGEETGAKLLLLHSCHNVTEAELNDGISYLSLMKQNLANLKEGLN